MGRFANPVTGTYTPATGDTILNDTTFSSPDVDVQQDYHQQVAVQHGTDFYLTTSSNLDWFETSTLTGARKLTNTLMFGSETDNQVRLSEANFVDRTISEKRALARGVIANRFKNKSKRHLPVHRRRQVFCTEDLSDIEWRTFQEQFVMGFFQIVGDGADRDAAMARSFQQYKREMNQYIGGFESRFGDIINQVMADHDTDIAAFTAMYQQGIDQYEASMERLEAGFGEARGLLEGIDQTLEDIIGPQKRRRHARWHKLATGLSGTSFGRTD